MDHKDLKAIAAEVLAEAEKLNILSRLYWYSPESRKQNSASSIGYYDSSPQGVRYTHGCKLIIVFPRLAFNSLESIINRNLPGDTQVAYRDDYKCKDVIGFDVYQRVQQLKLNIEPGSKSSKKFTANQMLKKGTYWYEQQLKALREQVPPFSIEEIDQALSEVSTGFKKALSYLQGQQNQQAVLTVRRLSGFRHRMIRIDAVDDKTQNVGFSDLALIFSSSDKLPTVVLPKAPNQKRKPRNDSMAAKYQADPSSFKYYDKFGIFEVYDN